MQQENRRRVLLQTAYLYAVIAAGVLALAFLLPSTVKRMGPSDFGLLVFVAMGILSEWAHVPLARGSMSLSFAIVLPAFAFYGTGGAAVVEVVGYLLGHALFDARGWKIKLFNTAQYTLTCLAGGLGYHLVSGIQSVKVGPVDLFGLIVFALVYFVVNHSLVGIWFTLTHPEEGAQVIWSEPAKWEGLSYLITAPLGLTVIMLYSVRGLAGAAALFFVSLVAAFVFRLTFRLEYLNRELRILYESAQALTHGLDLDGVKGQVFEILGRLAPYGTATLFLWDDVGQVLRAVDCRPEDNPFRERCFQLGEAIVGEVAERRVVEVVDDTATDPRVPAEQMSFHPASLLVAPMVVEEKLVGVLVLGAEQSGCYGEEQVRLLTIFAGQAGAALNRAVRYQETRQLAITDSKTGVYNYRFFYERLIDEIRRHEAKARPFSLIFVDVDYLKGINDRYGHQFGDEVLRQVAMLVSENVRDTDEVARYGGEEFVVLLPNAGGEESLAVAERIRRSVESHDFVSQYGFGPVKVTVTAGVATYPEHATQPDELIFRADEAMYLGKHRGRNRVFLYTGVTALPEAGPA